MASVIDLMTRVIQSLDDLEIPYFITGSFASSTFGEYRTTADIDIVAQISDRNVAMLCAMFRGPRYYLDETAVRDAIRHHGMFNINDSESGFKADVIIPAPSSHDRSRFARARRVHLPSINRMYWFASPEDVIVKKMEFFREGGSDKRLRDIAGIIKNMGERLQVDYIEQWAARLDLREIWDAVQRRVAGR